MGSNQSYEANTRHIKDKHYTDAQIRANINKLVPKYTKRILIVIVKQGKKTLLELNKIFMLNNFCNNSSSRVMKIIIFKHKNFIFDYGFVQVQIIKIVKFVCCPLFSRITSTIKVCFKLFVSCFLLQLVHLINLIFLSSSVIFFLQVMFLQE